MPRYIAFLRASTWVATPSRWSASARSSSRSASRTSRRLSPAECRLRDGGTGHGPEIRIASALQAALGYEVATFLRTDAELARIAAHDAFPQSQLDAAYALNIAFLAGPLDAEAVRKLMALKTAIDDFAAHEREIYWLCLKKQSESTFSNAVLEKTLGRQSTLRGANTVQRMAAKYAASG